MPARKKPPGTRQDNRPQRAGTALVVVPAAPLDIGPAIPEPPAGLSADSLKKWNQFWESSPAAATEDVDHLVVERWIFAYDEWRRALNAFRRKRLVLGSTKQVVLNPLSTWVTSREAEMHRCETELGIGTKSRASLGISVGQAQLTAAELNRMTEEGSGGAIEAEVLDADEEDADLLDGFEEA